MKFNIFSELSYEVFSDATFIFNIQASSTSYQHIIEESLLISPLLNFREFTLANSDSRYIRLVANQGTFFTITYQASVETQYSVIQEAESLPSIPICQLDTEVVPYLFPSRHCQSDKLRKFAIKEFGFLSNEYAKVLAISDWIFYNTDYITGATDSGTSAYDTLIQREGVCKDFAHLGIALCRALDIPARYFTGYALNMVPPDFHACFEAYIGGHWVFFDPTRLVALNGLVKIAHSKDAADAAVANFFGNTTCTYMNIQCTTANADFQPFIPVPGKGEAISYEPSLF
ncbi:MAG: Transglutaminase-like putative cysteine protease [Ferruginibacter sp.]|nr:Transglutaminase-like putative cysteine protease [Ferruginibacter sp.]